MQDRERQFAVLGISILVFIVPLKCTQPVILFHLWHFPSGMLEWIYAAWPEMIFYVLLLAVVAAALIQVSWRNLPRRVWLPPAIFLATQALATVFSVNPKLSIMVLVYFVSLVAGFLLGAAVLRDSRDVGWLLLGWTLASLVVAVNGIEQANGGLQQMREYLNAHPEFAHGNPEMWNKVSSNRIFSTFVTPNALGDYIAVSVFILLAAGWMMYRNDFLQHWFPSVVLVILPLLYCLWKSVSKASYGVLVIAAVVAAWMLIRPRRRAVLAIAGIFAVAVGAFALGFGKAAVEKAKVTGASRLDYWRAAVKIIRDQPVLGTGPGTFGRMYATYKRPQDEDTKLVHNNYLQMWTDSGVGGFIAFAVWMPGTMWLWWRRWRHVAPEDRVTETLLWCGCLAFALHSLVDFALYMAGNAWPVFVLLGWLAASEPPSGVTASFRPR